MKINVNSLSIGIHVLFLACYASIVLYYVHSNRILIVSALEIALALVF